MIKRGDVSAVIFDLDGVLFNTKRIREERTRRIAECMNVHPTTLDFQGRHYKEVLGKRGFSWWQIRRFKKLHDALRIQEEKYQKLLFPKAEAVLRSLKNYGKVTGILSNREANALTIQKIYESIEPRVVDFLVLHSPKWRIWFDRRKMRYEVFAPPHRTILSPYAKPDPRMLGEAKEAIRHLRGFPSSIYYVGDNVNDFHFAEACGFSFVGVLSGRVSDVNAWRAHGVQTIMRDIGEFLNYFPDFKK